MAAVDEQTHYEVLEVSIDASAHEIERAYRIAKATYQAGSAAAYSLLSDEEIAETLRRVEGAYAILSDGRLRREYDARLRRAGTFDRETRFSVPSPSANAEKRARPIRRAIEPRVELEEPLEPEDGIYDGEVLRRIRMSRGIELEEVAHTTKINETFLQYIESNAYAKLPPRVYVRGFLREIARCLRLDPRAVSDTYLRKYDAGLQS